MSITIETASIDDSGLPVHAGDATAQVCLAFVRLEAELAARGFTLDAISGIRLRMTDAGASAGLAAVVRERLESARADTPVEIVRVGYLPHPDLLLQLCAVVEPAATSPSRNGESFMSSLTLDLSPLRSVACIVLPGDPGYAEASTPWNLAFPLQPGAVAVPRSISDVVEAVVAATRLGLRIAPQSTGHAAATIADTVGEDVLLLRLSELTGVTVDAAARTARVLGGTPWGDVIDAVAPHGLTALHGSAADVAAAGYLLGGGLSFYGRAHGLASGSVRAFEVVLASGDLVRATADEHPDLFWALRGGGGNFGVVVALELDLLPVADLVAGMLLWGIERGPDVVRAWADWTAEAPESVTSSFRFMRFPPLPELPPFLSGRSVVVVDAAILDDDEAAAGILAPLRGLAPELDTFARIPAAELVAVHMDPPQPTPAANDHALLGELPEAAIQALLDVAGPAAGDAPMIVELRQLGGALARPLDAALPALQGAFALLAVCVVPTPESLPAGRALAADTVAALEPWSTGTVFGNFAERPTPASALFDPDARARLEQVRDAYDSGRVWIAAHAV